MKIFRLKGNNEMKCVWLTSILTFVMAIGWNIIVTILVEVYEIHKYGSREKAITFIDKMGQSSLIFQLILGVGTELIMLVTALFIIKKISNIDVKIHRNGKYDSGRRNWKLFAFGLATAMSLTGALLISLTFLGYAKFIRSDYFDSTIKDIAISLCAAILLGIAAGVEEILFRGIILEKLLQVKGKVFALIVSSIIFSINHINRLNYGYLLYVFLIGMFLGAIYILSNSLYLSLGFHVMWNTLSYLICISGENDINIKNLLRFEIDSQVYYKAVICGCGIVLMVIHVLYKKGLFSKFKKNDSEII